MESSIDRIIRPGVRVILVDQDDCVFLFHSNEHFGPGLQYFIVPGGAVDPGENCLDAAVRELFEETGLQVRTEELGEAVAHTEGAWDITAKNLHFWNDELFYVLRVDRFAPDLSNMEEYEWSETTGWAWMTMDQIREVHLSTYPIGVGDIVQHWLDNGPQANTEPPANIEPRKLFESPWTDWNEETCVGYPLPADAPSSYERPNLQVGQGLLNTNSKGLH